MPTRREFVILIDYDNFLFMATIKQFEDLEVWQLSRRLCKEIGQVLDEGRFKNNFKMIGQMEGSSGSIMDNIAEGFER